MGELQLYTVEDIQQLLCISKTTAYQLVRDAYKKQIPFRVIKVGKNYRIPKQKFDRWINGDE